MAVFQSDASDCVPKWSCYPCRWYCLTMLSEVSWNNLHMQQPSFQKWGFARAKHQGPWCLLFLWCVHFEGGGPVGLSTNILIRNYLSWEGDSMMLAACLQCYKEVIRDNFVWFGRWWMNLHKRSCCSIMGSAKDKREFAKDSRKKFFIREEWPFPDKGSLINHHVCLFNPFSLSLKVPLPKKNSLKYP